MTQTNELAVQGLGSLAGAIKRTRANIPSAGGGKSYLNFGRDGDWTLGKDRLTVHGDVVILNPMSLKSGYVSWTNYDPKERRKNQKMGEEMAPIAQGVDAGQLPDTGWEWKPQFSVDGRFVGGDQEEFVYVTSSGGGADLFDELLAALEARLGEGEDTYIFPVVVLQDDHYDHPQYGKTYKPIFKLKGWADLNGDEEGEAPAAVEDKSGEEPDAPADAVEPEEEQEAPTEGRRRRRRKAA